jgi:hypothetical protein
VVTLDKYLIPNGAKYSCSLLFTPVNINDTGVGSVVAEPLSFEVKDGALVCIGNIAAGAELAIYNMGGVRLSSTVAGDACDCVSMPISGMPHGSYVVLVKNDGRTIVYKVVL